MHGPGGPDTPHQSVGFDATNAQRRLRRIAQLLGDEFWFCQCGRKKNAIMALENQEMALNTAIAALQSISEIRKIPSKIKQTKSLSVFRSHKVG